MSDKSYVYGFRKAAESRGVNPSALAEFVKYAFTLDDAKGWLRDVRNKAREMWHRVDDDYKPLVAGTIGGGVGLGLGALAGKLFGFGAGRGALAGLGIGGIGGALYGAGKARDGYAANAKTQSDKIKNQEEEIKKLKSEKGKALKSDVQSSAVTDAKSRSEVISSANRVLAKRKREPGSRSEMERLHEMLASLNDKHNAQMVDAARRKVEIDPASSRINALRSLYEGELA